MLGETLLLLGGERAMDRVDQRGDAGRAALQKCGANCM
jgi:hypothetical protein